MSTEEIISIANFLKLKCTTNNPFKICEELNFSVEYTTINPSLKAYTLRPYDEPYIKINSMYDDKAQKVLCAHELGHAIIHTSSSNHFEDSFMKSEKAQREEYEANLFAVALLFRQEDFCMKISEMSNYTLKNILDYNIALK